MKLAINFEGDQEDDIDQMISDAKTYEDNRKIKGAHDHKPRGVDLWMKILGLSKDLKRVQENKVKKLKQRRVRDLIAYINRLSAALFAAISVGERQTLVLQDLHKMFSTSYRTKTKDHEKRCPPRRNPSCERVARIPIFSGYPEQAWRNILDTIDEMIQERKSFIQKIKELVENMDIQRKIVWLSYLKQ